MDLKGKISLITGGTSGIGLSIANALAQAGSNLVICARHQDRNESVADELARKFKVQVLPVAADICQEQDCERSFQEAAAKFGTVHVLVNNAGIIAGSRIVDTTTEEFDSVIRTNVYGTFYCARAAYRQMLKNDGDPRGVIINLSSLAGKRSWSAIGTYSASKFAVVGITQALADEGKADRIKAVAICPGRVATPMTGAGPGDIESRDIAETVLYVLRLSPTAWPTEVVVERRGV